MNKTASGGAGVPFQKMVDYLNYFVAIYALEMVATRTGDKEAASHLNEGLVFAKRYLEELREGFDQHFSALAIDDALFKVALRDVMKGSGGIGVDNAMNACSIVLVRFHTKRDLIAQVADGENLRRIRQVSEAAVSEDPAARLNACSKILHKNLRKAKSWIKKAAALADAAPSDEEATVMAAAEAKAMAGEMAILDAQIEGSCNPAEKVDLKLEKANLANAIANLANQAPDPAVVKAVAAAERVSKTTHATEMGKKLGMSPEQEKAMMASGKAIIAAGAGSGKTRVLAGKVVDLITREGVRSDRIIATSFSKKSAEELKRRVKEYGGDNILDAGDDGFGTTHSVALKLLRQYSPKIARSKIMDSDTYLVKMAMKQVQMNASYDADPRQLGDPPVVGMFDGLYQPDLPGQSPKDTNWTPDGAQSTPEPEKDVAKEALHIAFEGRWGLEGLGQWADDKGYRWGRGLLKFARHILDNDLGPADLSPRAFAELKRIVSTSSGAKNVGRNRKLNMSADAFLNLMESEFNGARKKMGKVANQSKSKFWKEPANQWFNLGVEAFADANGRAIGVKRFSTAISKYRANLVTPSQAWSAESSAFAAVYGAYDWLKKNDPVNSGVIDFDDMLVATCKLLIANPSARALVQAKYTHLLVDEAQDLNVAQHLLFGLISGLYDPQTRTLREDKKMTATTFAFIGDDKQAIYEFRGATPDLFIEKSDAFGEEGKRGDFQTHLLETNYRSGSAIVDSANQLIAHNSKQIPMVCKSHVSKGQGLIHNVVMPTHAEGAAYAADEIEKMLKGKAALAKASDFGVAVRTNAEAYAYGVELLKRGIPFRSKMSFFNDPTTKALIWWLKLAGGKGDVKAQNLAVLNAHNVPRFNLNKEFESRLQRVANGDSYLEFLVGGGWRYIYDQDWRNERNVLPYTEALEHVSGLSGKPEDILNAILDLEGAEFYGVKQTVVDSLVERVKGSPDQMDLLAEESENGEISDDDIRGLALAPIQPLMGLISGYEDIDVALDYVSKLQKANTKKHKKDDPNAEDYEEPAVVIDTCHGWKGLEAKHMFVPMAAGVFPHRASEGDEAQMASERRLAYVALTRGQQSVTVINPQISHIGKPAGVSQFVEEACIRPLGDDGKSASRTASIDWDDLSDSLSEMELDDIGYTDFEEWGWEEEDNDPLAAMWKETDSDSWKDLED